MFEVFVTSKTWKLEKKRQNSPYIPSTRVFRWKSQHANPNWSLGRSSWLHSWAYWYHDIDHIGPSQNVRLEETKWKWFVWNWFAHNEKFNAEVLTPLKPEMTSGVVMALTVEKLSCFGISFVVQLEVQLKD